MPEPTNAERVAWAWAALEAFHVASDSQPHSVEELTDSVSDLIADLLHLARAHNILPVDTLLTRALSDYEAEVDETTEDTQAKVDDAGTT
jgi:hypothetical protein